MTHGELVLFDRPEPGIGVLTLNRPEKLNALSTPLLDEFTAALDAAEADPDIRVVILTGAGERAFVAGADIAGYQGRREKAFIDYQFAGRRVNDRLEAFPKPTIAAVNGYALGGGFEIALCCDVIVRLDQRAARPARGAARPVARRRRNAAADPLARQARRRRHPARRRAASPASARSSSASRRRCASRRR